MKRREFMTIISGAAVFAPLSGFAQETGRTYRLGVLTNSPRVGPYDSFFDELRRHGFVERQNLIVDGRGYDARVERLPSWPPGWSRPRSKRLCLPGQPQLAQRAMRRTTFPS